MEAQVMQVENVSCHTSISSLDLVTHKYLKNHFNELLNDKVYNILKELFGSINIGSMKEALPKFSIYNDTIARFVEKINSKYDIALTFMHLEPHEVGHWAETFQVTSGYSKGPEPPRPWQVCKEPHRAEQLQHILQQLEPVTKQPQQPALQLQPALADQQPTPPQVQVQQEEINRLINMVVHWSAGDQHIADNTYNTHRHWYTCNWSTPNMSLIVPDYNNCRYYNQSLQGSNFERQVPEQRMFSHSTYNITNVNNLISYMS